MKKSVSQTFSEELYHDVVIGGMESYFEMYGQMDFDKEGTQPYFRALKTIWPKFNDQERNAFLLVLKQVSIDTVASVLAKIDGSSSLESFEGDFQITHEGDVLEDLTDNFLAFDEIQNAS